MMRKITPFTLVLCFFLSCAGMLSGQNAESSASLRFDTDSTRMNSQETDSGTMEIGGQASVAFATEDYPVSPGDVYQLSFFRSLSPSVQNLIVENDMRISLGILGSIDAAGMTFNEARQRIYQRLESSYADSAPMLTIVSLGSFPVMLKGEVRHAGYVNVNGLSRLSSVVNSRKTDYASIRIVRVIGRDGSTEQYDLFRAERYGEMDQDPYLRPGDTVLVKRAALRVSIHGEVYRAGHYQLLESEGLDALIHEYAEGFTANALPTELELVRTGESPVSDPQRIYIDGRDPQELEKITLQDGDLLLVPNKLQYQPVIYFEGALLDETAGEALAEGSGGRLTSRYSRKKYTFEPGERLSTALRSMQSSYILESDLRHAYLLRSDSLEVLGVDIEAYLLGRQEQDPELQVGDTIVIPFKQVFVVVSGAVKKPGVYNYVQGRSYEYYVSLAGGIDKTQHWGHKPVITDVQGEKVPVQEEIQPEYKIYFSHNNPFRIITPLASVLSAVVNTILVVQNIIQ